MRVRGRLGNKITPIGSKIGRLWGSMCLISRRHFCIRGNLVGTLGERGVMLEAGQVGKLGVHLVGVRTDKQERSVMRCTLF